MMGMPVIFSYGGGTNSAAILVEMIKRKLPAPDYIIFCDTGAEQPKTYDHIKIMSEYAVSHGYPEIRTISSHQKSKEGGIYEMSMRNRKLPAVAYGFKSCSVQFKIEPADKFIKENIGDSEHTRIIGYDYDELNRAENSKGKQGDKTTLWFPLIEWKMGRDECIESIVLAGLPKPGKSSCFFCPNMRISEIKKLADEYPDLAKKCIDLEKAVEERNLEEGVIADIVGLGRQWKWTNLLATDDMFGYRETAKDDPCGCYDGES